MDDLDFGSTVKGFAPGQKVFNRYTLTRVLGRGGMGVVWLARDEELEREVALKFLPEVVAADPQAIRDLKRETRRSLELTHPHIIRIYDFVQDARTAAISMEYVSGSTLTTRKLAQPHEHFEPADLHVWVGQLCEALTYAHRAAQVVHRDLKPANLMIDARGDLKVADFGIAASVSDSVSRVSVQAGSSGTPLYMSPQQMMGEKPSVTDDVYALGATLYELLTSRPPFHTGNVILQVQNKVPPSVTERRRELGVSGAPVPAAWEETIAACLAKEPSGRPASATEVWERLNGARPATAPAPVAAAPAPPVATPPPLAAPPPAPRPASRVGLFLGLAAGLVLLVAAGWYFGVHAPEQARLQREQERVAAEARALAEREQREYAVILARIDAVIDGVGRPLRDQVEGEVDRYIAQAPERFQAEVATRWQSRASAWEAARLAAARGGVLVRTTPAGARVTVGAFGAGDSPLTIPEARLGRHPVKVRADGFEDWSGEIEVKENEFAELSVPLVRSTGRLTLASEPAALEVELVGRSGPGAAPMPATRQVRTPAELTLPTGTYAAIFRRSGWPEQVRTVEVARNGAVTARAEFVPGRLVVTSTPAGAEVVSGGRVLGRTPLTLPEMQPERLNLELRLNRYKPATVAGEITARQELRLAATLEPLPYPRRGQPFENTLGQRFVPVPGTDVLFCIWETRVRDFEAFVRATGHDATKELYSMRKAGWGTYGDTWRSPGFPQGPTYPVVGVNQEDARAFCRWLTESERKAGRLAPDQEYRLPTNYEWETAVGGTELPWGSTWPPPAGAGNYADTSAANDTWPESFNVIAGFTDGYPRSAPVGSFAANRFGIHDLGGNVYEFVEDEANTMRGGSFNDNTKPNHVTSHKLVNSVRAVNFGFRIVCVPGSG